MIKIFSSAVISWLLLFAGTRAAAQNQEVSLVAGTGLSGFNGTIQNGTTSLQPGFRAGVGYTRFFTPKWGIATSLELGYYQTKVRLDDNTVFSSYEIDSEGDAFEYRVKTKGYEEKQNLYAVNIPLLLQYQSLPRHKTQFYSRAGLQLSLPVSSRYKTRADEISAAGYYPNLNVEMTDMPVHGFGTQTAWKKEGEYTFNFSYGLTAEAGAKFCLSSGSYLYAGAYMDYGLNNLKKAEGSSTLLTYNPTALSGSPATGVFSLANTTGDVHLLSYGIKLRLAFHAGKAKKGVTPSSPENQVPIQPLAPIKAEENPRAEAVVDTVVKPEEGEIKSESREPEKIAPRLITPGEEAVLKTPIQFSKVGDTTLTIAAKAQVDSVAVIMQQYPHIKLVIEGHTCDLGSDAINNKVGLARASAVVMYLEQKGIDGARMQAVSKGADDPIVPNTSEANRRKNRRVVIEVRDL